MSLRRKAGWLGLLIASSFVLAQKPKAPTQSGTTVRRHRVAEQTESVSPMVMHAESALDKSDFPAAEKLLTDVVAKDPADFRAWFDLGYLYHATKRDERAIESYQKAITLKPTLFEANLRLGQLLLIREDTARAIPFLQHATQLKPENQADQKLAEAWSALARAQETSAPQEAIAAYRRSAEFLPSADPHIATGILLEKQHDYAAAEVEFNSALRMAPQSSEALAGLVNVYSAQRRLPEAEAMLRELLKREPGNATAHLQFARVLLAQNKNDEALAELENAQKASPRDADLSLELARAYAATQKFQESAEMYQNAEKQAKPTAQVFFEHGVVLRKSRRFTEAQQQLISALQLDPKMTEAYGELASAASEGKNFPLVIKVLDARARLTPDTAGTCFLRATAYDNLKNFKEAAQSYHRFLELAQGKFPDQEWQARHRLIAIEPKKN